MAIITGPMLDKLKLEVQDWYLTTRLALIEAMEEKYPYGAVQLTPDEQYSNFLAMEPEDWEQTIIQLQNRYRGDPDSHDKVNRELAEYVARMLMIEAEGRSDHYAT